MSPILAQLRDPSSDIPDSPLPPPAEPPPIVVPDPVVLEVAVLNDPDPDLITFATPARTSLHLPRTTVVEPHSLKTVDDLLSQSPSPPGTEASATHEPIQSPLSPPTDQISLDKGKSRQTPAVETNPNVSEQPVPPTPSTLPSRVVSELELQPSPLRRSKRHSSPVMPSSLLPKGFSTPLKPVAPLRLPSSSQVNRVQTKPMDSFVPTTGIGQDLGMTVDDEERQGRKRKRQSGVAAMGSSRLGSLSPDSTSVLHQLIPKPAPTPEPEPGPSVAKPLQKPSSSILGPRTPVFPQFGAPSTPSKLRSIVGDVTRTPVRRVLVAPSPGKSGIRAFGGTVFQTQSLDDPNRSPVRRVLVADAASSPRKDVRNPAVFSRDRSGSAELRPAFKTGRSASAEPVFSRPPKASSSFGSKMTTALPYPVAPKPDAILEEEEHTLPSPTKQRATSAPPTAPLTPVKSMLRQPTVSSRIPRMGAKPYARPPGPEKSKLPLPASRIRPPIPSVSCGMYF